MNEMKEVGRVVAAFAEEAIPVLVRDSNVPSVNTNAEAKAAIEQVVTQSPPGESRRIWAVVFAVLTAVLAVPEIQALLGPWAPVATAAVSAALTGWSKVSDPRPTR